MPPKTRKNASKNQSHDQEPDQEQQQARVLRCRKQTLFVQQVEKEAQERQQELGTKLDNVMAMVDRAYKVELLKVPSALQKTRIGDFLEKETSASEVSIIMRNESPEIVQPLKRVSSKKAKAPQSTPTQKAFTKATRGGKGTKQTKSLAGSNSTGNLGRTGTPPKRTQSRVFKSQAKPKLRSVVSTGDIVCPMVSADAFISVTTGQGQTVSLSEETKEEIDFTMLDDVAWHHIQRLKSLMDDISKRQRK